MVEAVALRCEMNGDSVKPPVTVAVVPIAAVDVIVVVVGALVEFASPSPDTDPLVVDGIAVFVGAEAVVLVTATVVVDF